MKPITVFINAAASAISMVNTQFSTRCRLDKLEAKAPKILSSNSLITDTRTSTTSMHSRMKQNNQSMKIKKMKNIYKEIAIQSRESE